MRTHGRHAGGDLLANARLERRCLHLQHLLRGDRLHRDPRQQRGGEQVVFTHAMLDIETARQMAMGWRTASMATGTFSELLHRLALLAGFCRRDHTCGGALMAGPKATVEPTIGPEPSRTANMDDASSESLVLTRALSACVARPFLATFPRRRGHKARDPPRSPWRRRCATEGRSRRGDRAPARTAATRVLR